MTGKNRKNPLKLILGAIAVALLAYFYFAGADAEIGAASGQDTGSAVTEAAVSENRENETEEPEEASDSEASAEISESTGNGSDDALYTDGIVESSDSTSNSVTEDPSDSYTVYTFANSSLLNQHYEKHGIEMGFASAEEYEKAASDVVNNPNALHKTEAEDGDDVYYLEETNEFVIISSYGYIRTYFNPSRGIDYYNDQ